MNTNQSAIAAPRPTRDESGAPSEAGGAASQVKGHDGATSNQGGRFGLALLTAEIRAASKQLSRTEMDVLLALAELVPWPKAGEKPRDLITTASVPTIARTAGLNERGRSVGKALYRLSKAKAITFLRRSEGHVTHQIELNFDQLRSIEPYEVRRDAENDPACDAENDPACGAENDPARGAESHRPRNGVDPARGAEDQYHHQNHSPDTEDTDAMTDTSRAMDDPPEDLGLRLLELKRAGIREPSRSRLARLPWATPERIEAEAWAARALPGVTNPSGLMVTGLRDESPHDRVRRRMNERRRARHRDERARERAEAERRELDARWRAIRDSIPDQLRGAFRERWPSLGELRAAGLATDEEVLELPAVDVLQRIMIRAGIDTSAAAEDAPGSRARDAGGTETTGEGEAQAATTAAERVVTA